MQHLTPDRLAALVDEEPQADEALHLELCGDCRAEREELRLQTRRLAALAPLSAPADGWEAVRARLEAVGLLPAARPARRVVPLLRAAAALALFLGGAAAGAAAWAARGPVAPVAAVAPATAEGAAAALREAEDEYLAALARYAELSGAAAPADPANRLAALEGIALTARAALEEEPTDPVINGYLLTALGQREAILRSISTSGDTWF